MYSSVQNRDACTFINFERKIPPARPARLFHPSMCIGICPARLSIYSPMHGLILDCTFNDFFRIFPTAHLFCPRRLFGILEGMPGCGYQNIAGKKKLCMNNNLMKSWQIMTRKGRDAHAKCAFKCSANSKTK